MADVSPLAAIGEFDRVSQADRASTVYTFKALKQLVKLHFMLHNLVKLSECFSTLLSLVGRSVSTNEAEKTLIGLLDLISSSNNTEFLLKIYSTILDTLPGARNEVRSSLSLAPSNAHSAEISAVASEYRRVFHITDSACLIAS
jgi:hypothetical protein